MSMHIFIIGFMGCGKTFWSQKWSAQSGFASYDLDAIIEEQEQKTIAGIFDIDGEERFRQLESSALRSLQLKEKSIIACGGGTPCFHNNMRWMNENGTTVFLNATPEYILKNIQQTKTDRPLLKNVGEKNLLSFIQTKLNERKPFYEQATFNMDPSSINENTFTEILNSIQTNHA